MLPYASHSQKNWNINWLISLRHKQKKCDKSARLRQIVSCLQWTYTFQHTKHSKLCLQNTAEYLYRDWSRRFWFYRVHWQIQLLGPTIVRPPTHAPNVVQYWLRPLEIWSSWSVCVLRQIWQTVWQTCHTTSPQILRLYTNSTKEGRERINHPTTLFQSWG